MPVDYKDLGKRIREVRRQAGITQEKLAEKMGISASYLGHVERGTRIASLETVVAACNALQVSMDYLLKASLDLKQTYLPDSISPMEKDRLSHFLRLAQETVNGWDVADEVQSET